jgi:hypothetical protein
MAMSEETKQKLREQIHITKPWLKARGAVTPEGKMRSSQNALRHGRYSCHDPIRLLAKWEREEIEMERFMAIAQKMYDACCKSNVPPPERWEDIFEIMKREDFINIWRSL